MCWNDMNVAVFASPFVGGDVSLRYCPGDHRYKIRYAVEFRTPTGFSDFMASCTYDAADSSQVAALMLDAIDIARTPLSERN